MNDKLNNLQNIRHSCAHLLAAAVKQIWPNAKNAIGPAIETGFYQDFDMGDVRITEDDLGKIESKMREILKTWNAFAVKEVSVEQAKKDFANNPYKLELVEEFSKEGKQITENDPGNFLDLCKGGHSKDPQKEMQHFKLLSLAGAYWRGDEKNKMLTRIYGTCFPTQKELDEYLWQKKEAKKRDHKKIGQELDLFSFHDVAPGAVFWHKNGWIIYRTLQDFIRQKLVKEGYEEISTPVMVKSDLFKRSGHWEFYNENMFNLLNEKESYSLKPMNCPEASLVYSTKTRSYQDLPLRLSEFGILYRNELSGVLGGLFRVRQFTIDDAHHFVRPDQIQEEIHKLILLVVEFYKSFNFAAEFFLSTKPDKAMGDPKLWKEAEKDLEEALKNAKVKYGVKEKDGAFYGPKIDIHIKDSQERDWQLATIQLDFQIPEKLQLEYIDKDGKGKRPIIIHRAILGSLERFIGILTEHFQGAFPLWISPVQVKILPIADRHKEHAQKLAQELVKNGIRAETDIRPETLQAKIRDATLQKVPYLVIIGDKEIEKSNISVRLRDGQDLGQMDFEVFLKRLEKQIDKKI